MHAAVAADRVGESPEEPTFSPVPGTEAMGGRRGRHPLVAGGYVLASLMPDREHRLVKATEVHGVRFGVRWLELRGSPGSGDAEFQTYLHHGPDAALVEDVPWEEQGIECPGTELFGHVLSFRQPERRGGGASAKEVAKVRCIAFRSSLEAEAWVDMAAGTRHGDAQVVDAARSRLLQSTQQRQSAVSSAGSGDELGMQWCFLRDDQDIRTRVSMEPDDLAKHYIAKNKKFNEEVQRLVVQCGNQDLRGQLESSNTCQIISTNTCEVLP